MSDEQTPTPKRRGRKPKAVITAAMVESALANGSPVVAPPKPVVQVTNMRSSALARRLAKGANPHATGTKAIPLKEQGRWHLYIANDMADEQALYRMRHELGWEPLLPEDLACKPEDVGFRLNETGALVRGPQGREMIFKMLETDYQELQMRKTERNNIGIGSKAKDDTANAVGRAFGDEAGSYVQRHVTGTITDTREPLP